MWFTATAVNGVGERKRRRTKMEKMENNDELMQCHACLNVQTTLTPMVDFVDILGNRAQIDPNRRNTIVGYPLLAVCDVCVVEQSERMQYFVSIATKPANHPSNY
tara:strand:- start:3247 stop:3561 length:315 start_codon:yes stop_codon:yes gene_type:complete